MPGAHQPTLVCVTVVILLSLSAELQRFLQSYKDQSAAAAQTASAAASSGPHKEYVGDFQVYYTSSMIVRHSPDRRLYYPQPGGQILMDNVPENTAWGQAAKAAGFPSTMPFNYPPFAAVVLEPLSLLRWPSALLLWRVVLVGIVLLSIYLCLLLTGREHFSLKFGFAAVAVLSFFPLTETLVEGQIDPLILLFWMAGIFFFARGHSFWSAFSFALGTLVKISPVLVVALFVVRRRWTWLISYAASIAALSGISLWRLGWNNHILFLKEVLPKLSCGMPLLANRSLPGLIYDLYLHRVPVVPGALVPGWVCTLAKMGGPVLVVASLYFLWRRNKSQAIPVQEFMVFTLLSLLISPVSWRHHYLIALLPLIFLWTLDLKRRFDLAVLGLATLSIGTVLPDYVITAVRNPVLDLLLVSLTPISTLLLLYVYCVNEIDTEDGVASAVYAASGSPVV